MPAAGATEPPVVLCVPPNGPSDGASVSSPLAQNGPLMRATDILMRMSLQCARRYWVPGLGMDVWRTENDVPTKDSRPFTGVIVPNCYITNISD